MTATVPALPATQDPAGPTPDLLDGAWWPRSLGVLDPQTVPVSAAWLTAAVSGPLRLSGTGRLIEEAARPVSLPADAGGEPASPGPTERPSTPGRAGRRR